MVSTRSAHKRVAAVVAAVAAAAAPAHHHKKHKGGKKKGKKGSKPRGGPRPAAGVSRRAHFTSPEWMRYIRRRQCAKMKGQGTSGGSFRSGA